MSNKYLPKFNVAKELDLIEAGIKDPSKLTSEQKSAIIVEQENRERGIRHARRMHTVYEQAEKEGKVW